MKRGWSQQQPEGHRRVVVNDQFGLPNKEDANKPCNARQRHFGRKQTPHWVRLSSGVCRIEHPQSLIDTGRYGEEHAAQVQRGKGRIPVADYKLNVSSVGL